MSTVAVPFSWTPSGASSVEVAGSWDAFQGRTPLHRTPEGAFKGDVSLPASSTVQYKFIVDGTWRTSPGIPTQDDGHGNANHVLQVPEASALPQETPGLQLPGAYLATTPGLSEAPPTAAELTQGATDVLGSLTAVAAGATAGAAGTAAAFMASVNGDVATGTEAEMQGSAVTVDQLVPAAVTNTVADTLGAQIVGMDAVHAAQQPASAAAQGASASSGLTDAAAGAPLPTVGASAVPAYQDLTKVAEQQDRTPADAGAVAIAAAQASITGAVAPGSTTRDVRGTEQLETVNGTSAPSAASPAAPAATAAAPAGDEKKHGAAAAATAAGAALGAGAVATATGVAKSSDAAPASKAAAPAAAPAPKAAPAAAPAAPQKNGPSTAPTAAGAALGAGAVATATGVVAGQKEASKSSRPSSIRSKRNSVQLGRTPSNASTASRRGPSGANGTNGTTNTVNAKPVVVGAAPAAPALSASANIRRSSSGNANKKDLPAAPRGGAAKPAAVAAPLPPKASARKSATPAAAAPTPAEKPTPAAPVTPQKSTVKEKRGSRFGSMSRRKSNADFDKLAQEHPVPGTQASAAKTAAPAPALAAASPAAADPTTPDRKRKQSIFGKIKAVITPTSSPSK